LNLPKYISQFQVQYIGIIYSYIQKSTEVQFGNVFELVINMCTCGEETSTQTSWST